MVVKPDPGLAEPTFSLLPDGAGPGSHSSPGSCPVGIVPPTCPRLSDGRAAACTVLLLLLFILLLLCWKVGLCGTEQCEEPPHPGKGGDTAASPRQVRRATRLMDPAEAKWKKGQLIMWKKGG